MLVRQRHDSFAPVAESHLLPVFHVSLGWVFFPFAPRPIFGPPGVSVSGEQVMGFAFRAAGTSASYPVTKSRTAWTHRVVSAIFAASSPVDCDENLAITSSRRRSTNRFCP